MSWGGKSYLGHSELLSLVAPTERQVKSLQFFSIDVGSYHGI